MFHCTGQHVITKGFTSIMPWLAVSEKNLPQFTKGDKISITKVDLYEVKLYLYLYVWMELVFFTGCGKHPRMMVLFKCVNTIPIFVTSQNFD